MDINRKVDVLYNTASCTGNITIVSPTQWYITECSISSKCGINKCIVVGISYKISYRKIIKSEKCIAHTDKAYNLVKQNVAFRYSNKITV